MIDTDKRSIEVTVFDWEKYDRSKTWYIIFVTFFAFMIIASILFQNLVWAILLFFLLWWYILFSMSSNRRIKLTLVGEWVKMWWKFYPWWKISWFVLEIDEKTQLIKNIVLIVSNNKLINTLDDSPENIKQFILILSEMIPMLDDYDQTFIEKLARQLKL